MKVIQQKATRMRKRGKSYNEISKELSVAKSTLSYWLKNIPLKEEYRLKFYNSRMRNLLLGSKSQKERRLKEINHIVSKAEKDIIKPISFEAIRLMGAALYWAEGSKNGLFQLTNSDPHLVLFMTRWIKAVFGIKPTNLKVWLNIYSQQDEKEIKKFWSDLTGIPTSNFGKSFIKPLNKGYKKNNLYYGTAKISIPKSVDLRHRIFGWIKGALSDIDPKVVLTQERWNSIMKIDRPTTVNFK